MNDVLAIANAKKLIEKYCIKSPRQYTIDQIINAEGMAVDEKPLHGFDGSLIHNGKFGIITINSSIKEETQKRFTAAHELGHYCNEKSKFKFCSFEEIMNLKNNSQNERNANSFAAELLMHEPWFKEKVKSRKLNVDLLKELTEYFNVSLSAVSIRLAELDLKPCAVIMTTNGIVKWASVSKSFRYQFIRWGSKVSELSYTYNIFEIMKHRNPEIGNEYEALGNQNSTLPINHSSLTSVNSNILNHELESYLRNPSAFLRDEIHQSSIINYKFKIGDAEDVPARAWFREDFKLNDRDRVMEFNIPFWNYNSVLSVVY